MASAMSLKSLSKPEALWGTTSSGQGSTQAVLLLPPAPYCCLALCLERISKLLATPLKSHKDPALEEGCG